MKRTLFLMLATVLLLACENGKNIVPQDDAVIEDGDTIVADTGDTQNENELPDIADIAPADEDAILPTDDDLLVSDEDLITKTACLETGEGCAETEICLYDWALSGYYCEEACDPSVTGDCPDEMLCEPVEGDANHGCFLPVFIAGRVFDIGEIGYPAIEGARVSGMDQKNGEGTEVSITDSTGHYSITLPFTRQRNGMPVPGEVYALRAAAQDYRPYPGAGRVALPILMDTFTLMSDGYYVSSGFLDIGLLPLSEEEQGGFTISGALSEKASGVLILARCATTPCPYTYTDTDGDFTLYNVQPGDYEIAALKGGMSFTPVAVTVLDADITDLLLELVAEPELGSISGQVNIVDGGGGLTTSVVMMAEETFLPVFDKGEIVPGLRAPESPQPPTISGAYTITGIPAGRYVVLAAFENDWLVRDPDPGISGTQILHLEMPATGGVWNISLSNFKVTRAIDIVSPGALGPEQVDGQNLVFIWKDDSSETHYNLKLFNAYGEIVWEKTVPRATGVTQLEEPYDGSPLSGYYQWRVTSLKTGDPISTSEDLKGIFYVGMPW